RTKMWAHDPHWRTYGGGGEPWLDFEAVRGLEDLGEDVLLIPLFGHTHGHCGVAINTPDGWLLHAGDAYFDAREIKLPERRCGAQIALFQLIVTTERANRRHNQDRLRALHADHPEVEVFCAHNPFEYIDLCTRRGRDTVRGTSLTRRWDPTNLEVGTARFSSTAGRSK